MDWRSHNHATKCWRQTRLEFICFLHFSLLSSSLFLFFLLTSLLFIELPTRNPHSDSTLHTPPRIQHTAIAMDQVVRDQEDLLEDEEDEVLSEHLLSVLWPRVGNRISFSQCSSNTLTMTSGYAPRSSFSLVQSFALCCLGFARQDRRAILVATAHVMAILTREWYCISRLNRS